MHKRRFTGFKKLVSLLGADYDIMVRSGTGVQTKFYFSAVTIVLIFAISFLSIRYAINLLFHVLFIEVFLSLFLSLLFVCIYIFLLHTFAKKQLGREVVKKTFLQTLINPSNCLRTGFVIFMGFVIAKPVEIYVFEPWLNADVQQYKSQLLESHQREVDALYKTDINRMEKRRDRLTQLGVNNSLEEEVSRWNRKIDSLQAEKQIKVTAAEQKIAASDFFVFRVKTVITKYKLSFLICGLTILIFLLPGYLIYSLSENEDYYQRKNRIETALVLKSYHALEKAWTEIFASRYGKEIQLYTVYEDPPFNTKRKPSPTYQSQTDFLKKYSS